MEQVLCFKRANLPEEWIQKKTILNLEEDLFFKICSLLDFEFKQRDSVENNTDYKQLIPYIILQTKDFKSIGIYKRKGSEQRLHDLWSIGIGGHINPIDLNKKNSIKEIIIAGMNRELNEELSKMHKNDKPEFIGIINEEETNVGSVHIGAVFRILTDNKNDYLSGDELVDFQWIKTKNLANMNLELWSRLAFELIA
jgi:predicted NUDIX family phosphoesterase